MSFTAPVAYIESREESREESQHNDYRIESIRGVSSSWVTQEASENQKPSWIQAVHVKGHVLPLDVGLRSPRRKRFERTDAQADDSFEELRSLWVEATAFQSTTEKFTNENYQKIIGLGPQAIPHILDDLRLNGPQHWVWALTAIVHENVAANATSLAEACDKWLEWADSNGYGEI